MNNLFGDFVWNSDWGTYFSLLLQGSVSRNEQIVEGITEGYRENGD